MVTRVADRTVKHKFLKKYYLWLAPQGEVDENISFMTGNFTLKLKKSNREKYVVFFFRDKGDFSRFSIHLERYLISNTLKKKCKFGQFSPNGQKL